MACAGFATSTNMADPTLDAVMPATPRSEHAAQVICAAATGRSVFARRLLTLIITDARWAIAAAKEDGVVQGVSQRSIPDSQPAGPSMRAMTSTPPHGRDFYCDERQPSRWVISITIVFAQ